MVWVTIQVEFQGEEDGLPTQYEPSVVMQFSDAARDRGLDGLREVVGEVAKELLRDGQILALWSGRRPRKKTL